MNNNLKKYQIENMVFQVKRETNIALEYIKFVVYTGLIIFFLFFII